MVSETRPAVNQAQQLIAPQLVRAQHIAVFARELEAIWDARIVHFQLENALQYNRRKRADKRRHEQNALIATTVSRSRRMKPTASRQNERECRCDFGSFQAGCLCL